MPLHHGRSDLAPAGRGAAAPIAHSQIDMLKQVQRTAEQISTMHFPKMESARCTTTCPSSFSLSMTSNCITILHSLSLHRVDGEPRPKTRLTQSAHHGAQSGPSIHAIHSPHCKKAVRHPHNHTIHHTHHQTQHIITSPSPPSPPPRHNQT